MIVGDASPFGMGAYLVKRTLEDGPVVLEWYAIPLVDYVLRQARDVLQFTIVTNPTARMLWKTSQVVQWADIKL